MKYFKESINTLNASRLKIWMAVLLGKKQVIWEGNTRLTLYTFRGVVYLTGYKKSLVSCTN